MDVKELNYALKIIVREGISKCSRKPDHPNLSSSSLLVQGRSEGGSWGARDSPFVSLFLRKQPIIFRGENAMTIMFDKV